MLGPRAQALGPTPVAFDAAIAEAREVADRRALVFESVTYEAELQLERAGIAALPLKGVDLARDAHGRPGARISGDVDLLVGAGNLERAVDAIAALGYRPATNAHRSQIHVTLVHEQTWRPPIEVHWRVHWYGDRFAARLLADTMRERGGARKARPSAMLVALLLFYARDGLSGLRLPADIAAYADALADRLPPAEVAAYVADDPEIAMPVHAALAVLRETVGLQLAVPCPSLRRRDRMAMRLADWRLAGESDQISATVRLVDGLLAPPNRLRRFVTSRFTPFETLGSNALYFAKTMVRWAAALTSIRRGRTAQPLPRRGAP